jgi:ParB/RepB/Spo0J family partition protein
MDIASYRAEWVGVSQINVENKAFQFRKDISAESVADLAGSFKADGQKLPILLWRRHSGELQLISGFRRVTAAKSLGWEKVLAIIIPEADMDEAEALRLNFIENIERKSLNSLDIMYACKKLKEQGKSNVEIGRLIGKDEKQVRRYLGALEEASLGQCPSDTVKNKNNYVKSNKKVFEEKLKIEPKPENTAILEAHIDEVKKAWKEALKLQGKSQCKVSSVKCKGKAKEKEKATAKKVQGLDPETEKTIGSVVSAFGEKMSSTEPSAGQDSSQQQPAPSGKWVDVPGIGLDVLKSMPKEALLAYKAMLDSGNSAVVEAALMSQGIKLEDFKAAIDESLKG